MTINEIGRAAYCTNVSNGWEVFTPAEWTNEGPDQSSVRFLATHVALVHSEVSEATEAIRHKDRA